MKWLVFILTSFFLSLSLSLTAQQLIFKTYTVEDGLVSNPVRRIFQDSRGFIWIATWEGLSKYDGNKFTNYTTSNGLSHNLVNDLYESAEGKLYVAENNGTVDILQRDAIVNKAAFSNVLINKFHTIQNNRVIALTDTGGIHEIRNGKLIQPVQSFSRSTYNDLTEINDSLLIGGAEGSFKILNRRFEIISEIKQPKEQVILKTYKDSKNKIWIGTNNGLKLVSVIQKKDHALVFSLQETPFDIPLLKNLAIFDILNDADGNLWIATANGLVKIPPDNNLPAGRQNWQSFSEKDGLPSSVITSLYQDKEKNIWVGTTLGLAKLVTKNSIRLFTINKETTSNSIGLLITLKDNLFLISTQTGMQLFNNRDNLFSPISSPHNLLYGGVVQNSQPMLFHSNNNGFGKYDPVNKRMVDQILPALPNAEVYCSVMDTNGIIFSGTQKGLIIGLKGKFRYENTFPYRITFLHLDNKGFLWAGTWNNGLFRIEYTNKNNIFSLILKDYSELLPDKNVRCLLEDSKGNFWVGTRYQGVVQLTNNNNGLMVLHKFDLNGGLMSNWAKIIAEDERGCIWIGSNLGIDKLIPQRNSFSIFNFSRANNYFANINQIVPGNEHSLWLATGNGLVNIIDDETEKTPPASVFITSVGLGDTSFNYNTYLPDKKVQLRYYQNQAKFEFSAPGFTNEKQIFYSYRLFGSADTIWSQPANVHNVSYASLQPGDYQFEVRTIGWNKEWGVPANFAFIIKLPYWQTWWFYTFIGILVLLLLYSFYLYRIRQLLKLQKVRNRIASDLHDDIGATLTNINILSEISRKNLGQPKEAEKFLRRISEEVTSTSQALNDIIWSVNSRNDTIEEILTRMRRYAAELFDNSDTNCFLSLDEAAAGKKLSMEQRKDLYLIYKESMNNIFKHAEASNVWINIKWLKGKLHLKIKDDGIGFDSSLNPGGNGLKNIRSRTEKWKGNSTINTATGSGTLIEIIIPLAG